VLTNPALVPASVLMRREVFARLGGFDESLRTAEDIDFHLRVAAEFKIGVIEESLTIAMRGHEGLSAVATSDSDYVRVMERFTRAHGTRLGARVCRTALFAAYHRNARSAALSGRSFESLQYAARALPHSRAWADWLGLAHVAALGGRALAVRALRIVRAR
jgi:Glycosyltransferase like family 2